MGHYVIRVKGVLSRELTDAYPNLKAEQEPAQTVLHGHLAAQGDLTGVLDHLDLLGVDILEIIRLPVSRRPADGRPEAPAGPR
ncbi:hypothetical protein [Kribbella sp. CA-247076]|uniref:hypothetical protein n=1 Tax=Kribbella sp. CA-247076 TaxID=3239941 RepID=UPI003D8EFAA3